MAGTPEAEVKGQEEGGHKSKQGPQDKVTTMSIHITVEPLNKGHYGSNDFVLSRGSNNTLKY